MPYVWLHDIAAPEDPGAALPSAVLRLWPHQSLTKRGFALFIGVTVALLALPLLVLIGSPVVWALLPFMVLTVAAVWLALKASWRQRNVTEELRLWPDRVRIDRRDPRRAPRIWEANPHWVQVTLHATGGPVENYLTLRGAGREVELGAFLSPEERHALCAELTRRLGLR